jgi:hypothetical protein
MKNVLKFISIVAVLAALCNAVFLALVGYHENIIEIGGLTFAAVLGFVLFMLVDTIKPALSDKQISDAMTHSERKYLREKMERWSRELDEEEIEKLSRGRY